MKFLSCIFILVFTVSTFTYSQSEQDSLIPGTEGKIEIVQDSRIESLISKHISINESKPVIDGYRVQIFFISGSNSKKMANDTKASFISKYPDMDSYVIYQAPNFKVRVGDFRTKIEAYKFLHEVKKDFPSAFIVRDEINLPKIN